MLLVNLRRNQVAPACPYCVNLQRACSTPRWSHELRTGRGVPGEASSPIMAGAASVPMVRRFRATRSRAGLGRPLPPLRERPEHWSALQSSPANLSLLCEAGPRDHRPPAPYDLDRSREGKFTGDPVDPGSRAVSLVSPTRTVVTRHRPTAHR